ncbi:MAG: glycosyltransferase [Oscillospiraceae bacterium]|nr:glycosyltransferase [Oscillospiraceae bacterium]
MDSTNNKNIGGEDLALRYSALAMEHERQHEQLKQMQLQIEAQMEQIEELQKEKQAAAAQMQDIRQSIQQVLYTCEQMVRNKSFKLLHLLNRFLVQFCRGTAQERKEFWKWLADRKKRNASPATHKYNPLYQIINPLQDIRDRVALDPNYVSANPNASAQEVSFAALKAVKCRKDVLKKPYQKYDVIVFAIIDYDFRYQRPQQIADHYVRQGHRVFYVNANFKSDAGIRVRQKGELYQVTLSSKMNTAVYSVNNPTECAGLCRQLEELMVEYGIRDALMIADYPTWVTEIDYLKKKFGFPLITDYMDDFTGFVTTCESFVKDNCISLLKLSDAVAASSQYLVDVVSEYNSNVTPIRNGTEFEHFYKAYGVHNPRERKIIGYYGAIAEWFDFGKIEYLAREFPECDIVLIGNITNDKVRDCDLPNVKKLGEMPYAKLPEYLCDFDVCLIPFDTSTNLIKATNPVKFYEYLSAGKKIVATQIPELEPFQDKFVYLANDDAQFASYVRQCLDGTDTLAEPEECFRFARDNDWEHRVNAFEEVATGLFPKVSVVVLCYNQLDYTKQCVESILDQTAYPNYELILVDNNSTDDTAEYLREMEKKDERIKIVLNTTNRGFAGGNNDGIAVSDGEYIVLLNNDTLVTRGWLTGMTKHFRRSPKVGMVGAVTNSIGNEAQIDVSYKDVVDMPAFAYAYTACHMGETYRHDGVLAMYCVMFSRELTQKIGLLDENYGIGMFEDDDYSVAAERAGYELILPEDVFIHHFGSVSFKKLEDATYRKTFEANKAYFEKKWDTTWQMHHYRKV